MNRFKNKHFDKPVTRLAKFLAVFGCSVLLSGGAATAGTFADDACDPDYYESLEARAWLEAQREITQNQNLIFKNDSVLEYTCFDQVLGVLADRSDGSPSATQLFTDTNRWGTPPSNVRTSLNAVVATAMNNYQTANFNHSLLGGRTGLSHTLPASLPSGAYNCQVMDSVWEEAKCMDFIDVAAEDGFFTFAEYEASADKRHLPTRCTGSPPYQANMDNATDNATTPWEEGAIETYYDRVFPTSGGACGGTDSHFVTGLRVNRTSGSVSNYDEHACVVPGCYWDPSASNCVEYTP